MSLGPPAVPSLPFKNRRGWLIAFGIFEILIACAFLLVALLVGVAMIMSPHIQRAPGAPELRPGVAFVAAAFYVVPGLLFLLLGVGSIKCRTWARIGSQIASGFWLFIGTMSTLFIMFILPGALEQQGKLPPQQIRIAVIGFGFFSIVLMVLIPATLLVFYSLGSVRATCQTGGSGLAPGATPRGHTEGALPVPLIVLMLLEGMGIFSILSFLIVRATVVFGIVVHGPAVFLLFSTHAGLSVLAAWLIWRRSFAGWAICFFKLLFWTASWVTTLLTRDLLDTYREMGLSTQQLQPMSALPHFLGLIWGATSVGMVAYLGFIIYTRKFFLPAVEKGQAA